MNEVPALSAADLQDELALIHRRKHRTFTTALYARGEPSALAVSFDSKEVIFRARPVRCELEFRRALANRASDENLVLLVDYPADRLAADLQGRIAAGRVYAVNRGRRIARLFEATAVSAELVACRPLCEALLADGRPFPKLTTGTTVDLHTAWRSLLFRVAGLPVEGEFSDERILAYCSAGDCPSSVASLLGPSSIVGVELVAYLERSVGALAPITWRAWLAGKARGAAALAFVLEIGHSRLKSDAGLRASVIAALQAIDPALKDLPKQSPGVLAAWGGVAEPLRRRLPEDVARVVLDAANELIPDREVATALAGSRFLRVAFELRLSRLASLLMHGAKGSFSAKQLQEAREELDELGQHELQSAHGSNELISRARMAVRLLAYALTRPNLEEQAQLLGSNGAVFTLAEHYVSDGGYVDFARERARGAGDNELEIAIEAVLARLDGIRERDDEMFARAYASWTSAGCPTSQHVVSIAKGLDCFAADFLKEMAHRRLLVILLDGMSWANAVELLQDCEAKNYAPLRVGKSCRC